ncbi:MAG TPA: hypothetical protein PKE32_02920 [Miltoncostaeaceae bacterium]|nr:hypothetical protein [Miltoncostaeaceae bacterium]
MLRDTDPTPNELQRALLEYDPTALETALIEWTKEHWPMVARSMVYHRAEADKTVEGVMGLRDDEAKLALQVAARVAIGERELMCRAVAAVLPQWLEETYGLKPKGA